MRVSLTQTRRKYFVDQRAFSRKLMQWSFIATAFAMWLAMCPQPAHSQLRGHGGPVRALAISPDGTHALSGSFDTSAIRWSLSRNVAEQVMRFHDGPVNSVVLLRDGRVATGGDDAHIALWRPGEQAPDKVLDGHSGPVVALAVSPDSKSLGSASWDRTVRVWPLAGGAPRVLEGNTENVNGVAFSPDGTEIVSVGYDGTIRIWQSDGNAVSVHTLPSPLNSVVVAPDGEIIVAGATGQVFFVSSSGELLGEVEAGTSPVIQLAISHDGALIAAATIRGSVAVIDRKKRNLMHTLVGPGLPVWSVAFFPDNRTLLTGGTDGIIRRWKAVDGEPIDSTFVGAPQDSLKRYAGDHGADVFHACVACHALASDEGAKAGPTLWHILGRRIATLPGYNFSPALKKLDIVWSKETIAKLFEVGPSHYTPGTKMPEQTIGSPEDRKALVDFLERATAN
jgi:cytochrome c